jgi:hypothetical protein
MANYNLLCTFNDKPERNCPLLLDACMIIYIED